jgi:type III pantothenate kinase
MLLCIDIGNTHTHYGLIPVPATAAPAPARPLPIQNPESEIQNLPTRALDDPAAGLGPRITALLANQPGDALTRARVKGIAFCSVVPAATERLRALLAREKFPHPILHLTHDKHLGLPIAYPRPAELGQDRLANAAAVLALGPLPAIVIDMGTAVTFDVITPALGYEGGIIAPGVELMRRYLHEQTAQLPLLDDSLRVDGAIGRSTIEAMRIGAVIGFGGMVQALLDAIIAELAARRAPPPRVYATGGAADLLRDRLRTPPANVPDLTLRGLAATWPLNMPA